MNRRITDQQRTTTLLCLDPPRPELAVIRACGYRVAVSNLANLTLRSAESFLSSVDIVLLDVTAGGRDRIEAAQRIHSAACISGAPTRILCFSSARRTAGFVLELTKCGARYVRISDPAMLIEAIELLVAEGAYIKRVQPCFQIRHRFSRGSCGPGEEISAIELDHEGSLFQLPLALSGRFVFNYLAENRPIALDAFQIISGLNGWFYRDHALNGGIRQTTKVRVATVKVLVQRIRQAMASAFTRAGLTLDPYDVWRSFHAEGSTRALYRLNAEIRFLHPTK